VLFNASCNNKCFILNPEKEKRIWRRKP